MFGWIEEVTGFIEESINTSLNNPVGLITEESVKLIFDMFFDWLYFLIYDVIASLFTVIDETTADIFDIPWVDAFIMLFHHIGWILFVCGLIVAVFDTAIGYENGQANIKGTCLNVLKGFFAASLITVVPQRLYSFCVSLQHTFSVDLTRVMLQNSTTDIMEAATSVINSLSTDVSPSSLFFIILFGYCVIKVILANVKRGGILLCQIAVGSLYMFSVPRGYTDGFVGWCKQVIATCLTAFLQTSILYLGLITFQEHPIVAVGLCLSSTEVPRIAQMFGLDTSIKVNMMSISSTVSMGSRAIRAVGQK